MMKYRFRIALVVILVLVACSVSACGNKEEPSSGGAAGGNGAGSKNQSQSNGLLGDARYGGKMVEWSNDALKVAFLFPEVGRVTTYPGEKELVRVSGPEDLKVGLQIITPRAASEAEFKKVMGQAYDGMPANTKGFVEYRRKLFDISGHPAAYIEYKWNVMNRDFHVLELSVMKENYQYVFMSTFLTKDDNKYQPAALEIINSFRLLDGEVNLGALKKEDGEVGSGSAAGQSSSQAGSESAKSNVAVSKDTGREGMVLNIINSEFGDTARLADWKQLKQQYGDKLPEVLAAAGLGNKQAAWVANNGQEYAVGKRHFFVQRFDSNRPADFLAHDQVGTISLGSWYDINIPVMVIRMDGLKGV